MSYFTTGGPGKERGTNTLPPTGIIQKMLKGERKHKSICPSILLETSSLEAILAEWCVCHQGGPWVRIIGQRQPETNLIATKMRCKPLGRAVLLGSLTLLLSTQAPLPSKDPCLVSLDNSFPSVRQEHTLGPWKESPSCNNLFANMGSHCTCPSLVLLLKGHQHHRKLIKNTQRQVPPQVLAVF